MIGKKFQESKSKRGAAPVIRGAGDWVALIIATGFGAGLIPLGPGTWGSAVGLLVAYGIIETLKHDVIGLQNALIVAAFVSAGAGIWSASRAERMFNRKDSGQIVIDEVCGQIISFIFIAPYLADLGGNWRWWMITGFLLFRIFDIFKPYPINQLQNLQGGFGVMMDDVVAGIYAAVILSLLLLIAG